MSVLLKSCILFNSGADSPPLTLVTEACPHRQNILKFISRHPDHHMYIIRFPVGRANNAFISELRRDLTSTHLVILRCENRPKPTNFCRNKSVCIRCSPYAPQSLPYISSLNGTRLVIQGDPYRCINQLCVTGYRLV